MFKLILVLLNLLGYRNTVTPVRLEKKMTVGEKINNWIKIHEPQILLVVIIAMMIIIVLLMVKFFPAMDGWNNRFEEVL